MGPSFFGCGVSQDRDVYCDDRSPARDMLGRLSRARRDGDE